MKKLDLPEFFLDLMIENFCDSMNFIREAWVVSEESKEFEEAIDVKIKMVITSDVYLSVLKIMIKQCLSKGVFSLYRYIIEKSTVMNPVTLEDEEMWTMICEIPNAEYLSYFDTTRIQITPSVEISSKLGPIQGYNSLVANYIGSGLMRCHTTLLSQHQSRFGQIKKVEKNPKDEMSTVSKIAFMKPLKDLQKAVNNKAIEKTEDISSCILLNMPIRQGTGAVDVGIDVRPYLNQSLRQHSRITKLVL
jgi:hypothetical protein